MEILERCKFNGKEYICMQELSIDDSIIYVCRDVETKEIVYLRENSKLEIVEDEITKEKVEKLIYVKSIDYSK